MVGTGIVATTHNIGRQQISCHTLDLFRDADVALQGEFHTAGCADAAGNTFVARIQNIAIASANRCLPCRDAVVRTDRRFAVIDLDAIALGRYTRVVRGRNY